MNLKRAVAVSALAVMLSATPVTGALAAGGTADGDTPVSDAPVYQILPVGPARGVDGSGVDGGGVDGGTSPANPGSSPVDEVEAYIREQIGANVFAGLWVEPAEQRVVVALTEEVSAEEQAAIKELAGDMLLGLPETGSSSAEVVFQTVPNSFDELRALQEEIEAAMPDLEADGIRIDFVGVQVMSNKVQVGIRPFNDETMVAMEARFGSDAIAVVEGDEVRPVAEPMPVEDGEIMEFGPEPYANAPVSAPAITTADDAVTPMSAPADNNTDDGRESSAGSQPQSLLQRIVSAIKSFFGGLFD